MVARDEDASVLHSKALQSPGELVESGPNYLPTFCEMECLRVLVSSGGCFLCKPQLSCIAGKIDAENAIPLDQLRQTGNCTLPVGVRVAYVEIGKDHFYFTPCFDTAEDTLREATCGWRLSTSRGIAQLVETGRPFRALFQHMTLLLEIYTRPEDLVLDPFMGTGSTLVAAQNMGRRAIGFEIAPQFVAVAEARLRDAGVSSRDKVDVTIYNEDARNLTSFVESDSVDFVVTSPPYWNIQQQRRTADGKSPRPYTSSTTDLGNIESYSDFLNALNTVFRGLHAAVRPGRWCVLIVMDLRKTNRFYAFHIDCIDRMTSCGFRLEDIIIWDRRSEYHNLRPLGFPTTFRVNKAHEYILIFQKPSLPAPKT